MVVMQLEAEVLLLRDTLAEHRSLSRSQRTTLTQLVNSHARAIDACRTLQDAERTKYGGAIKRLAEAKEEILAFEFRVFIIDQDLATLDLELKKEKHERLGVEAALEMEKRDRSSLDGQLQIEKASRVELGQQLNDAYAEVASAMGLCLDTESTVSLADKLERMMRRFRTVRTDNDALQVTLESALFDSCTMDATIAELESENSILADAGDEKDKSIEAFNTEKTQLLREASELRVEVDQLARAGLDKDAVITKLAEEKLRWVLASHVWDAENTILREENTRLSCDIRVKDGKISELVDEKQRLQETVDAFSCSLVSYNFEDRAKDETIGALKDEIRLMEDSIVEKDEAAAMLGECIDRLRGSSEALCNTIERLQDESLVKDMRVKMSEEMLDALHESLEFVYLEQKAKVGALLPERD
ncbi:hypothetical protein C8Q72DRAFT_850930 [Fomitopsis betulina]|nr:hypothetical protein C8Q72DRAFT_850930 [Fomitopsis betulina]